MMQDFLYVSTLPSNDEVYQLIYHILLFVDVNIDYFPIDFHIYNILKVLFFWYRICNLCEYFFFHYAESTQNDYVHSKVYVQYLQVW